MTPTLTDSRALLYAALGEVAGVDAFYDHEPTGEVTGPVYGTIQLERITPTEQVWAVRIYSQLADSPEEAARSMDVALVAVDDALASRPFGPSTWDVGVDDRVGALVARSFLNIERSTF